MRILVQLNHPAHYHLFINAVNILRSHGHDVLISSRNKDILEELLINIKHIKLKSTREKNLYNKIRQNKYKTKELKEIVNSFKPDIVLGTAAELGPICKKKKIPSLFFAEDDVNLNLPIFFVALFYFPYLTEFLSPRVCYNSLWDKRTIKYEGYHELAYLHPNKFIADKNIVEKYFPIERPYFILRFAELSAYHDIGIKGISSVIAQNLIYILKPHGDIYISSERTLEPQFEPYRIKINPLDIHHVMAFAQIFIGDSQTMAAEAGVLGTPFVRFNDFVGRISYLSELEDVYHLGYGVKVKYVAQLYKIVEDLIKMPERKKLFNERREKMLSDKIDCTDFFVWFIENYPKSAQIMKENPAYQFNFR